MSIKNNWIELDKSIPVPLYYQLKQSIIAEIQGGNLKVGDSIPTEAEFSEKLGISRPTIRQALSELVSEGYLHRMKGKGTFISRPKIDERFFQQLQSFNQEMLKKGLKPSTEVLDLKKIKGVAGVNEKLKIGPEEELIYLKRLRFADDDPIVYLETYLPYTLCSKLLDEDLSNQSLYTLLEEKYDRKILRASRLIEATNAGLEESRLLKIKKNQAICLVKTVAFTQDDVPVEYSIARYRGDRNQFSVELIRY